MATPTQDKPDVVVIVREHWELLTDEDVQHGLKSRETFLERLRHRYQIGLEDAKAQLHEFDKKYPQMLFERS